VIGIRKEKTNENKGHCPVPVFSAYHRGMIEF
jgi:hypothetical protein